MAKKEAVEQNKIADIAEQAKTAARNAYLANLGMYGKVIEQGQEAAEDFTAKREEIKSKGTELFEELVKRGEEIQSQAQTKIDEVVSEQKAAIEERLEPVREAIEKVKSAISREEKAEQPAA